MLTKALRRSTMGPMGKGAKLPGKQVFTCIACEKKFGIGFEGDVVGATANCPSCGKVLIFVDQDGITGVEDFHKWMNKQNPKWPADGKGAESITLEG